MNFDEVIDEMQDEIIALEKRLAELENELSEEKDSNSQLQKELKDSQDEVDELSRENKKLDAELKGLERSAQQDYNEFMAENECLKQRLKEKDFELFYNKQE